MRLIDADKLKQHYAWWKSTDLGRENQKLFDDIVDAQPTAGRDIPQMVYYEQDGYADGLPVYDTAECPNRDCNMYFEEGDANWKCNYCPKCGQKLKWEEGEERDEG